MATIRDSTDLEPIFYKILCLVIYSSICMYTAIILVT